MPRVWEAMKDVVSCEKLGGTAHEYWSLDIRMGQPGMLKTYHSSIYVGKPTRRTETSKYPEEKKITNDSPSSGERTGKSPNLTGVPVGGCRTTFRNHHQAEHFGKSGHRAWELRKRKLMRTRSILSRAGPEESCLNLPAPSGKAKYSSDTDSEPVP